LIDGLVFNQQVSTSQGGPTKIENAKIGLIQFQLSPPKTNMESTVMINDYVQMDRILREERAYLARLCKEISKTGCNVLLIQKSILRDAVTDLSLHFLAKLNIMVIRDIERDEIEFISKTLGCTPVASIEAFTKNKLGEAKLVESEQTSDGKVVKVIGVKNPGKTVSILVRGSNKLILDEAERSLHDALCVIRSLVKKRYLLVGGGAPEIEVSLQLSKWANTLFGKESYCVGAFGESLEVIPYTLAENAGLHPIAVVTELRSKHEEGKKKMGISVKKGGVADMQEENVIQPLSVTAAALKFATETVCMILKIDDIVAVR